ncbi:MAG: DinB family protein [Terriglobia bacterium]
MNSKLKRRRINSRGQAFTELFLAQARHSLRAQHLSQIIRCLKMLSEEQIWWRAHSTSNSAGNLILHLAGNVRQWIISGLGDQPDQRERDKEFAELGPIPRRLLIRQLEETVAEACKVLGNLSTDDLAQQYLIQGFRVRGMKAVAHVTEHFAYHTGQIIYLTKLQLGVDTGFTRLPDEKAKPVRSRKLAQF